MLLDDQKKVLGRGVYPAQGLQLGENTGTGFRNWAFKNESVLRL